ncbi:DUF4123 domain-containing protein [Paraburkholderia sp. Ac-20340]|uniref:DUF4123 domain-containing protein n=1 Tax=Paraburkholderia sp. Ac-20340 TaxID=2703888 RepID=UPI00197F24DC|nr:DUF4123 domain-containing protein [Paraburkholderia sp. Ac-20340]MBN3853330.1 DUF4123 domain-containing protein [Paraburkholderia sp. Ac-20340]
MNQFLIVETSNGAVELDTAPRMYHVGEIVPDAMPELKGVMPSLFSIEHAEEQLPVITSIAARDAEEGLAPRICACVHTEAAGSDLLLHLGNVIALPTEPESFTAFRFYDPRVFRHLEWILRPDQLAHVFGPITHWDYFSGQAWTSLTPPAEQAARALLVSKEQRAMLGRVHRIEQVLKSIRDAGEALEERGPRKIDALLIKGENYGLSGEDLVVFAVQGALISPDFDQHPAVAAALRQDSVRTYTEITSRWTDEHWAQIIHDLAHAA